MDRDSFDEMKQKKKVTFSKETFRAYESRQQNNEKNKGSHPGSSQLEQLEHNNEHNNNQQTSLAEQTKNDAATACNSFREGA